MTMSDKDYVKASIIKALLRDGSIFPLSDADFKGGTAIVRSIGISLNVIVDAVFMEVRRQVLGKSPCTSMTSGEGLLEGIVMRGAHTVPIDNIERRDIVARAAIARIKELEK